MRTHANGSTAVLFSTKTYTLHGKKCVSVFASLPNASVLRKRFWGENDTTEQQTEWKLSVVEKYTTFKGWS